ncbi:MULTISPECIES: GIY-YIG nuclease family protein [unclassified Thioalkalivibrio]|uniref:GIY-YIG nuclease family protein n=1 Tax=unclassified Thioalkalivibrio TaxID=2621013 RepID=UPI00035E428C|nr:MULTISPECIES: GIY-YIG nuclease family protein [unclassified Thioalkalivibrio]
MKQPCVYIMSNRRDGALYVGVTSNLVQRVWQHRSGEASGFTSRYGLHRLVWFESCEEMTSAIEREKQLKAGPRRRKVALIEQTNPEWRDLFDDIVG